MYLFGRLLICLLVRLSFTFHTNQFSILPVDVVNFEIDTITYTCRKTVPQPMGKTRNWQFMLAQKYQE